MDSYFQRPSSHADFLRERLHRSGALVSSRSALSRNEAQLDDNIVDVGENKQASPTEHLLARLEQHGLRRCLYSEEDPSHYAAATNFAVEEPQPHSSTSTSSCEEDTAREAYYYLCVPCELRLTCVSRRAATEEMLQDVHYHFSSASHRRTASWMADADIDATLRESPLVEPPEAYIRIYVNGVPLLLSRRPGGGDMFYALPHEEELTTAAISRFTPPSCAPLKWLQPHDEDHSSASASYSLLPSSEAQDDMCFWYRPLRSLCTYQRQIPRTVVRKRWRCEGDEEDRGDESKRKQAAGILRARAAKLVVQHVPMEEYKSNTLLNKAQVPTEPALLPLCRTRLSVRDLQAPAPPSRQPDLLGCEIKSPEQHFSSPASAETHRMIFVQGLRPVKLDEHHGNGTSTACWSDRCVVRANGVYRLVLVSSSQSAEIRSHCEAAAQAPVEAAATEEEQQQRPVTLTRALLSQLTNSAVGESNHSEDFSTSSGEKLSQRSSLNSVLT